MGEGRTPYEEAVGLLSAALRFGINPSLDGIRALASALASPQAAFRACQVTGTNGKTSVVRMTGALLAEHGVRTGVYTSPHLVSYTERIEVGGEAVSEAAFAEAVTAAARAAEAIARSHREAGSDGPPPAFTEFEILTAAALWLFGAEDVDWACLEVGMGGRWDATSVVDPSVSVVTGVGLDHTDRLGSTREEIAADKAYVIKPGTVAVLGPGCAGVEQVLFDRAFALGVPVLHVGEAEDDVTWRVLVPATSPGGVTHFEVDGALERYDGLEMTAPAYQVPNAATAVAAAEAALGAPLDPAAVRRAFAALAFPGRFERMRAHPPLVLDGAHNPEAARVLAGAITSAFGDVRPVIVLGVLADKDAAGIVAALAPVARRFVVTQPDSPRALPAGDLAAIVRAETGEDAGQAAGLASALALVADVPAVVTGSLYTAGEARALLASRL